MFIFFYQTKITEEKHVKYIFIDSLILMPMIEPKPWLNQRYLIIIKVSDILISLYNSSTMGLIVIRILR